MTPEVWIALIGVVGTLAAALLSAHLTSRQAAEAERRRTAEADRTRFHQERRQAYVAFGAKAHALATQDPRAAGDPAYEDFRRAYFEVHLLGSERVRDAAYDVREAVEKLSGLSSGSTELTEAVQRYNTAPAAFDATARSELNLGESTN